MTESWKPIELAGKYPFCLSGGDVCYYARDYISHGSFSASVGNNLISNFKKEVSKRKNLDEWRHKLSAIDQFALELHDFIPEGTAIAHIPSSKAKNHPEYDSRLEDTLAKLKSYMPTLVIVTPFEVIQTLPSSHKGGERDPEVIYSNLRWLGLPAGTNQIVLIDDVITSGAHFNACKRILTKNIPGIEVVGVFWAKTVWVEAEEVKKAH